jgi:hypothetical protein
MNNTPVTLHRNILTFKLIVRDYYISEMRNAPQFCGMFADHDSMLLMRLIWDRYGFRGGTMSHRYSLFDVILKQRGRGRGWLWEVCSAEGAPVMTGSRSSRSAASYEANRALFLLLSSAPYRSQLSVFRAIQANQEARARRSLPPELLGPTAPSRKRPARKPSRQQALLRGWPAFGALL